MKPLHSIFFFIAGTLLMMRFYGNELLLLALMALSAVACLAIDKWKNAKMFLIAMLVGGLCENLAVMMGAWGYSNAGYLFAPLWLPVGWGMAVVLLEEAFAPEHGRLRFSKRALIMAFGGTYLVGMAFPNEIAILTAFVAVTFALIATGYYRRDEMKAGVLAALFGTAMETACIMAGSWHYTYAMFGTPLWLPLCWFNAFLIMRRLAPSEAGKQ
ncbi:MAG: hypothetical protein V1827_01470 [Candidatus Micrarchaeota archaeon]